MRVLFPLVSTIILITSCGEGDAMKSQGMAKPADPPHQDTNYIEGYKPDHPISFPHAKHADLLGITCAYCHSGKEAKTAGLPSIQICLDCHKSSESSELRSDYQGPIGKDSVIGENGIIWKKVHSLPDSIYFFNSADTAQINTEASVANCDYIQSGRTVTSNGKKIEYNECSKCHY